MDEKFDIIKKIIEDEDVKLYSFNLIELLEDELFLNLDRIIAYQYQYGIDKYSEELPTVSLFLVSLLQRGNPTKEFVVYSALIKNKYGLGEEEFEKIAWEVIRIHSNYYFYEFWKREAILLNNKLSLYDYIELLYNNGNINLDIQKNLVLLSYYSIGEWGSLLNDFVGETYLNIKKMYREIESKGEINNLINFLKTPHDKNIKKLTIDDVDLMNGIEFEEFIEKIFNKMKYKTYLTKKTNDQGIDLIAEKYNEKIGIQTKCYSGKVGNKAIQEAVAGMAYYQCNKIIVVTNNTYTNSAINLAKANNVVLWDRTILIEKINYIYNFL